MGIVPCKSLSVLSLPKSPWEEATGQRFMAGMNQFVSSELRYHFFDQSHMYARDYSRYRPLKTEEGRPRFLLLSEEGALQELRERAPESLRGNLEVTTASYFCWAGEEQASFVVPTPHLVADYSLGELFFLGEVRLTAKEAPESTASHPLWRVTPKAILTPLCDSQEFVVFEEDHRLHTSLWRECNSEKHNLREAAAFAPALALLEAFLEGLTGLGGELQEAPLEVAGRVALGAVRPATAPPTL